MKKTASKRDLLTLFDLKPPELLKILSRAAQYKKLRTQNKLSSHLKGKNVALVFEKPSTRTKVSFDVAVNELGGHSVSLQSDSSQLGRGESYEDTARVLSRYVQGIVIRTFGQEGLEQLAKAASIPVINALSDFCHPCQVLADLLTIQQHKDKKLKATVAYIGDGNNMANTWIMAALILGFPLQIATPPGYECAVEEIKKCSFEYAHNWKLIAFSHDPVAAVKNADVINIDTWFSMGQDVSEEKKKLFEPFQLNAALLKKANKEAIVLHCLPAHRGEEVTDEVLDGPQSRIWDEAENRLHVQKAVLEFLVKK